MDILWDYFVRQVGKQEAEKRLKQKQQKLKDIFTPEKTVSQVLKMLRGINGVKPMALGEVYDKYAKSLNPLEVLADGTVYSFPDEIHEEIKLDSSPDYLIQRNDENMGYVVTIDRIGLYSF